MSSLLSTVRRIDVALLPTTKTVGVADCATSANPDETLATYALGSCIAVVMYDPVARIGGLLHYLLPDCSMDTTRGRENPFLYADSGIPELLNRCIQLGAQKRRIVVYAAGGASVLNDGGLFNIGHRNHVSLRKALWKAGLLIQAEAVGGNVSRSVRLEVGTGKVWIREGAKPGVELIPAPKAGQKAGLGK